MRLANLRRRYIRALLLIGFLVSVIPNSSAQGAPGDANDLTKYISPVGRPENDGTSDLPWPSVAFALARVGGGKTIILKPGFYRGPIVIDRGYSGTREAPTVIRSEIKWKAVVAGFSTHNILTEAGCNWVVIDGLEILGARADGVKIQGDNSVVRNCWVHNNTSMGITIHGRKAWTIEANLVEFNGQHVQFQHGIYADGEDGLVRNNIIRNNAGYGIQLYPSCRNCTVVNNLVFGHYRKGGLNIWPARNGGRNLIANNTVADNAYGLMIYNDNGDGVIVANNILAGPSPLIVHHSGTVLADYNLCLPSDTLPGQHNIAANPRFVDADRGFYYLMADSPAIARATREHALQTDFWGRPLSRETAPDLGAFAFSPAFATKAGLNQENARNRPELPDAQDRPNHPELEGWAYRFGRMPDPWTPPTRAK